MAEAKGLDTRVGKSRVVGLDDKIAKESRRLERNNSGPGDIVKEQYDKVIDTGKRSLWDNALQIGSSGFGKGMLIAAFAVIAVTALTFGFGASLGQISMVGVGTLNIEQGIAIGIGMGTKVLLSGFGAVAALAGGVVGAMVDWRTRQTQPTLEEAQTLAKQYEEARSGQKAPELEQQPEQQQQPDCCKTPEVPPPPVPAKSAGQPDCCDKTKDWTKDITQRRSETSLDGAQCSR